MNLGLFESIPVAGVYVAIAVLIVGSCEAGFRFGLRARRRQDRSAADALGPMVGGLLGMLAFVLAFTFAMAADQHGMRKGGVLEDANAIGTAYLRADLLAPAQSESLKRLLNDYVELRLQAIDKRNLQQGLARSLELQNQMWAEASLAARAQPDTNTALVLEALNNVIDVHEKRVTAGLYNRIPGSVWIALISICTLAMLTLGLQMGLSGKRRFIAVLPLSLAFAVLVTLVVDLDRPQGGLIKVGQQSMVDLQQSMTRSSSNTLLEHVGGAVETETNDQPE